ncbi:MAG: xanthine dehydrogenase family protein subunit M [Candidatus Poribacteria bacterium]|nr:xanthine dehydrogenase family protein subunit M [Candidatus Poribacteria bacterium]
MEKFSYVNATSLEQVTSLLSESGWGEVMLIAGGTDLLGELKEYIETPKTLVNLKTLPGMDSIEADASGLKIGALATVADIAMHPTIQHHYTVLSQAAGSVATPQIRNVGTLGGNLCQRPRCWYYRDESTDCLKKGGDICYAVDGLSKYHAILGGDPVYIVHPSDLAPALIALGASVKIVGPEGEKTMSLEEFFTLPAANPFRENVLEPNEIVVEVSVPAPKPNTKSFYLKAREKGAPDFALSSVAGVFEMDGKTCKTASIVLGGVAPAPWRSKEAEAAVTGKMIDESVGQQAGADAVKDAEPLNDNMYKVTLTRNLVSRAAMMAAS